MSKNLLKIFQKIRFESIAKKSLEKWHRKKPSVQISQKSFARSKISAIKYCESQKMVKVIYRDFVYQREN